MRILMLGWELPPHNSGGLGVACYHMAKALADQGATIDFVLPYKATHPKTNFMTIHSAVAADPLYRFGLGAYEDVFSKTTATHNSPIPIREIQKQYQTYVTSYVKEQKPDVIHAHDWLTFEAGIAAKKQCGSSLVVHVHATEFDRAGNKRGNPIIHDVELEGLLLADRIIAVSDYTKRLIVERYHIPAEKIEVIHNSVDIDEVTSSDAYATYQYLQYMKREGYTIVTTLGRLTVQKGLHQFLRAAAKAVSVYDSLLFVVAGDGELRDELIARSAELGIADKVMFTGFIRGKAMRDAYGISDIFVMSSVSEPFGLTALEAAANKVPLILSHQSGVSEVFKNALKADCWDSDRIADEIIGLATSTSLRDELSENAFSEFKAFSWNEVAERCMRQYNRVRQLA